MEAFALYLLKSVTWISGFALVFILFLRNERFFFLKRIYLLTGILTSLFFPLIAIHYTVILPAVKSIQVENPVLNGIPGTNTSVIPALKILLMVVYTAGFLFVLFIIIRQGRSLYRVIKKSEVVTLTSIKLIKSADFVSAFSFFSYVFVNPSITDIESREIMNHELVHIRQKHWFDLLLVELLCMFQWFNPLVWIYARFIRQNHEYLADEVALQRTSDPAIYRAALLNQIVGAPVVSLANSFNYSLNKKRFNMMKNIISSPYRKAKILLILPVFAIVLYSFAKPDYKYKYPDEKPGINNAALTSLQNEVKGVIIQHDGQPLSGAIITLRGTTIGTMADDKGAFKFLNVPDDGLLVVSFVGFKSKVIKPVFTSDMRIEMVRDTLKFSGMNISTPPPPPPPPPANGINMPADAPPPPPPPPPAKNGINMTGDGPQPLYVIDGKIEEAGLSKIDLETVESISVIKNEAAKVKYGEKGKNGVIEVTTKKPFVVVEQLPEFPGGNDAMKAWIISNIKYPGEAVKNKITGKVDVSFVVTSSGKIKDVTVVKPVSPVLDAEAKRVISSMPDWKPGMQAGKIIDVNMQVPVEFKLK
jgi:TonB family protein